jgi:WD40 repeat protein
LSHVDSNFFTCTKDGIKLWNTTTGLCERSLVGHAAEVSCVILLEDKRLCSASADYLVKIWNVETGVCEHTMKHGDENNGQNRCVTAIQLKDGRILSDCRNEVFLWNY